VRASVHNAQPWWFSAYGPGISLRADGGRQVIAADPSDREMVISWPASVPYASGEPVSGSHGWLDVAGRGGRVAFEVDGTDPATHTGWSVVVLGEAVEVTDLAELARLRELPLDPWAPGAKSRCVRILPAALTGRRISAAGGPSGRGGLPQPGGPSGHDDEVWSWEQP